MNPRHSIVIVSYNGLAHVQACLEAVRLCFAAEPGGSSCGEIIVVDNASRDGTGAWLKTQGDVQSVLNADNRGFSAACNQGANLARGEFLLFLNPDTWATEGSLGRMARLFSDPRVGAVGPLSNYVAGLQRLDMQWPASAPPLAQMPGADGRTKARAIAQELARHSGGLSAETRLLIGFCLMMRRDLFQRMGGMDEELFLGNDDLDLSWRLREKGMILKVALDAFVLHEGQKSFQTERQETVNKWVQESTDALYKKLALYYGGPAKVPSSLSLWGMDWFRPSKAAEALAQAAASRPPINSKNQEAVMPRSPAQDAQDTQATLWSDVTLLIPVPQGKGHEEALRASLDGLPEGIGEIMVLDGRQEPSPLPLRERPIRRLDVGADMPIGLALRMASRAAQKPYLLCLPAGLQVTSFFAHALGRRYPQDLPAILPLQVGGTPGIWKGSLHPFLLLRETWLREPPQPDADWPEITRDLRQRSQAGKIPADIPALASTPEAMTLWDNGSGQDWTPVADDPRLELYPASLQATLKKAKGILFAGTAASPVTTGSPVRGLDLNGNNVELADQDVILLRLTPDMVPDLPERLAHLRRSAPGMRRLVTLFNGAQSLGLPGDGKGWHAPIDLTVAGVQRAIRLAGYTVADTQAYLGFSNDSRQQSPLQGWHQIEALPRDTRHVLDKKVSLVILGFNQEEYTRKCIASIREHTRQNYELILVDNGSKDGTWEMFRAVPGAKAIRNDRNLGVAAGWNRGLREASGDYVCILNNDTLVGDGWLENMVRLCESDSSLGLVGPRSNRIAGPQAVENPAYAREEEIPAFVAGWNEKHALQCEDYDWVKGVCMLLPRQVVDKVGKFDERFGKGNFEDDDYCLRVRLHGFRTAIAHDSFLHHFGSVSFNQEGIDWTEQMRKNKALFDAKWSRGRAALADDVTAVTAVLPETPVSDPEPASTASDGEIARRLDSVQASYEKGDLQRARHFLLEAAAMDAGHPDVLNAMGIMSFHDGQHREAALCFLRALMRQAIHQDAARNLLDALLAMNGEVSEEELAAFQKRFPGNPVFARTPAAMDWKQEVDACISAEDFHGALQRVEAHLGQSEGRSTAFYYMGVIAHLLGNTEEAISHLHRALEESPVEPDALLHAAELLLSRDKVAEAAALVEKAARGEFAGLIPAKYSLARLQCLRAQEAVKPDAARLRRGLVAGDEAEALLDSGRADAARAVIEAHLALCPDDFRAHNNLGLCSYYAGDIEGAYRAFAEALRCEPGCGDALINAFDCALSLGRGQELGLWIDQALRHAPALPEALRLKRLVDREGAALLQAGSLSELESQGELVQEAEAKLKAGDVKAARRLFEEALDRRSANPQALNGLGLIAFGEGRFDAAYAHFQKAVALHPSDQDILINLWEAARAQKREPEALGMLRDSLHRHPDLPEVRAIVTSAA